MADLARMAERARRERLVLHNRACQRWQARIDRERWRDRQKQDARMVAWFWHWLKITLVVRIVGTILAVEKYIGK